MSYDLEFQKILFAQIDAACTCSVEVHPPHDLPLPYVQIGESMMEDNEIGRMLFADVHVWSSSEGAHETKTIQAQIRAVLHSATFTGGGYTFSCCREQDCRVFRDANDEDWHGVQTFRVIAS